MTIKEIIIEALHDPQNRREDGSVKWNGGANVKLRIFEKSSRFQHYVDSFNINTNAWVLNYVYKRLRFLNNRSFSQLGALVRLIDVRFRVDSF